MARRLLLVAATAAALLAAGAPAHAQDTVGTRNEMRESQLRLQQIRQERQELQQQMEQLRSRVHDVSGELSNIERQVDASASAMRELDFQSATVTANVDSTTRELQETRQKLAQRNAVLRSRLRSIYERGPMHSVRVLLGAESFGDLLNRYKYLQLIAVYDRLLVTEVKQLAHDLTAQDQELKLSLDQLDRLRSEKQRELDQLQSLQRTHQKALSGYKQKTKQAQTRLDKLARDEANLTDALAALERKRREEERRRAVAGAPAASDRGLPTRELGNLAWPVNGDVIYRFGLDQKPNGVTLRNNGIGIAAKAGTPVRSVEAGTVVMAQPFEGYGPTVMISHGGGYYTLYLYLGSIRVKEGAHVAAGQVVGTVGGARTPEGAHLEFQIRAPLTPDGSPEPVDPLGWLRARTGT